MTLIITDKPLEDFLEHIPPLKGPVTDEVINFNGEEIHTRSDLWKPHEYREYLVRGPLKIQRWIRTFTPGPDPTPPKVNKLLLENGKEWFSYTTHNSCSHFDMEQILFVYWYLANVGSRICLYRQFGLESLGPETPVARIDVSDKPLSDTILRSIQSDVLYVFSDPKGNSALHDTEILRRMGIDLPDKRFSHYKAPQDKFTLSDLRKVLGNCYSVITVYDYIDVESTADRLRFKNHRECYTEYVRHIDVIARTQEFADSLIEKGYPEPISVFESHFDECPVRLYKFGGSQRQFGIEQARIRDDYNLTDTMDVIAVIDSGRRKRPVPELKFHETRTYEKDGVRTHRLYLKITSDAVYGDLHHPAKSKNNVSLHVKLTVSSDSGSLQDLNVEIIPEGGERYVWNLAESIKDGIGLWCIDRMGSICNPEKESAEDKKLQYILDNTEGIQDESIKDELKFFIPQIAVKRVLTCANNVLSEQEPGLALKIDSMLENYNGESEYISCLEEQMRIDICGFVISKTKDDGTPCEIKVAKRFGGKN